MFLFLIFDSFSMLDVALIVLLAALQNHSHSIVTSKFHIMCSTG